MFDFLRFNIDAEVLVARDIGQWLSHLALGKYAKAFAENEIDMDSLPYLTDQDLKDIGVALGARRKLLAAIADLGAQVDKGVQQAAEPRGERRQVTVLFADLSNFTELSNELGAEATHALLSQYFDTVDAIVEAYGGAIDKHIGDSVMAVFGAPLAHGDDPERAARAALDVHAAMKGLSDRVGRRLSAHIGIASGQVVASKTGSKTHREYTVTGETVNLASRLQDQAKAGETLISGAVRLLIAAVADCVPHGELRVKGFADPLSVWELTAMSDTRAFGQGGQFAGRDSELRQFNGMVMGCLESGLGQALLLRGEAGIGKSRLIAEFEALAARSGFALCKGLVLDFGVGKGQDAIRSLVRSLLQIPPGSGKQRRAAAAEAAVGDGRLAEGQRVFLNDLLNLPQPLALHSLYDAMDNSLRNKGKRDVVAQLVERSAARQPLLVVIEDVHWADRLTLAHLAALTSTVADSAAILVMTSRVEGDPLGEAWRSSLTGGSIATLDLGPLRPEEAEAIATSLLDSGGDLVRDCIAKAEGNPLFLEQLLLNASEGAQDNVPGSIQSLVQARMDRLSPKHKEALQAASIVGQRFTLKALRHLLDDPEYECDSLERQHLVKPVGEGYLFAHALVRDGVYASLLTDRRRALHLRAAAWFSGQDLGLRAQHLERANDPNVAEAFREAAEAQAAAYRYDQALALVERGLALTEDTADLSRLVCMKGDLLRESGDSQGALSAYTAARDAAEDDKQRCVAEIGLAAVMRIVDRYDEAFAALERVELLAETHSLHLELAKLHHLRGNLYFPLGKVELCEAAHGKALAAARLAGSPEWEAQALGGLADAGYATGRHLTVDGLLEQLLALCQRHGFGRIEVAYASQRGGGGTKFYCGDLDEALRMSYEAEEKARAVGHDRAAIIAQSSCYICLFAMGRMEEALVHIERAKDLVAKIGARRFLARALQYEGKIATWEGSRSDAISILRQALAISRETGLPYAGPSILGDIAFAADDEEERRQSLAEGEALLASGSISHNYFEFFTQAIETSLRSKAWREAARYATALEDYTKDEPLALSDILIARGRALAAFGRGDCGQETFDELRRLREKAASIGFAVVLPALDAALGTRPDASL